jgi:glyoxylase I family protein
MPRLHHVAVTCSDLDRSLAFYVDGLGLGEPYMWEAPPIVHRAAFIPTDDGTWIELFDRGEPGAERGPQTAGMSHMAIAVDDVQAAFDRLVAAGGVVLEAPVTRTLHGDPPKQATMAFVAGPDGEVIELYRNDDL